MKQDDQELNDRFGAYVVGGPFIRGAPELPLGHSLAHLRDHIPADGEWTEREAECIDYMLSARTVLVLRGDPGGWLRGHRDAAELAAFARDVAAAARDQEGFERWAGRWRGVASVLEMSIAMKSDAAPQTTKAPA